MTTSNDLPPPYEHDEQPSGHLPGSQAFTLVLDGCQVHAIDAPSRLLYRLSNPPCEATTKVYGVEKVRYRVADDGGGDGTGTDEPRLRSRLNHIYDFQTKYFYSLRDLRAPVVIEGQTSRKRSYRSVKVSASVTGWSGCAAEDHFKAEVRLSGRLQRGEGAQILWRNMDGRVVAAETRPTRGPDGVVDKPPRLEVRESLDEKDLDLLVTCWAARLWKEAEKDLREPLTWDNFKKIAGQKRRFGTAPTLGSGALGLAGAF
ncbi:Essential for maintenance of the cell wall protein 1 [Purpureocillium lavendulum]|uniref:Essential for maintenance of the cell wall protein 1 n=1 Tax=Purpureocillium lavendulum TaxID=1247861 RepID=A0AB34FVR9_9HYPO|nr:Essential for maintenance of the cell wall protein 1 [Purpureocillium lavendulum]